VPPPLAQRRTATECTLSWCVELLRSVSLVTTDDNAELLPPATLVCLSVAPASDVTADDVIELLSLGCLERSLFISSNPL